MLNIHKSLRLKVMVMMCILAVPLLVFIFLFVTQMRMEAGRYQDILHREASIHQAAQQTINAAQVASQAIYKAIAINDPKQNQEMLRLGKVFQGAMINFELFLEALIHGSESDEFRSSKNGLNYEQWRRRGFHSTIQVAKPDALVRKKALELQQYYQSYSKNGRMVIGSIQRALMLQLRGKMDEAEAKREEAYAHLAEIIESENDFQKGISELFKATEFATNKARDKIDRSMMRRVKYLVVTGILCFLLAISMAWHFCNHFIVNMLLNVNEGVENIIHGDWEDKLEVKTEDEIGRLASNFNRMTDKLKTTMVSKDLLLDEVRERKRTEQTMEKLKRRLELILDSAGEGVFGVDPTGEITFANPAAVNMLGWHIDELVGQNVFGVILADRKSDRVISRKEQHPIYQSADEGKEQRVVDGIFFKRNGEQMAVEYVVKPIHQNKHVTGAVVCFSDISSRKKLEEQLLQSQKMDSVGRLAGGVAHDFNNLLMVIRGNCDFLADSFDAGDARLEDISEIQKATERAMALTDHLLTFSRHQLTDSQSVNINAIIEKSESILRSTIGENVELRLDLAEELGSIKTNPAQIEQILLNLALNAKDAMPEGGVLQIQTYSESLNQADAQARNIKDFEAGDYIVLKVRDDGHGMNAETKAQIFEPFFTTKKNTVSGGLGLSTIYGIMKQNKSYIQVESSDGEGATFYLYFPLYNSPQEDDAEQPVAESRENLSSADGDGSETILLVEDEPSLRKFVARGLKMKGYVIHEARDGADALSKVNDIGIHNIDLVVTDMVMPRMGGRELCEKIRELKEDMRLLVMSGYTDDKLVRQQISQAGIPFLQKPVSMDALTAKVRDVIDGKAGSVTK